MTNTKSLTLVDEWPEGAIPQPWVKSLFEKMTSYYGAKFADQWRDSDTEIVKRVWATELGKLSTEELKFGVAKLISQDWPPTLPQFFKLCRPDVDALAAYYEAVIGLQARAKGESLAWSHPAIFWAARSLAYDLMNNTYSYVKDRWETALSEQMARSEWEPVPDPWPALPASAKSDLSREKSAQMLREYGANAVVKDTSTPIDHKRWARKILKRGRSGVSPVAEKFALEALGTEPPEEIGA